MFKPALTERFKSLQTPFYYYDLDMLNRTIMSVKEHGMGHGYRIHFALKANNNDRILKHLLNEGFGADCVSGNEVLKAIEVGFAPEKIVLAGVGKSDDDLGAALKHRIFCINVESAEEVGVVNQLAWKYATKAHIALRINPNIKVDTHKYITTGTQENKFGILPSEIPGILDDLPNHKNIFLRGIHFHIGSQITDMKPFEELCKTVNEMQELFEARGLHLDHINVGGGLGIDYENPDSNFVSDFKSYFDVFKKNLKVRTNQRIHFELGRSIIGQCGSLVTKVLYTKEGHNTAFAIVDAGMTELLRPALYQAKHEIDVLTSYKDKKKYDVVGPICESSDTFRSGIEIPIVKRGDLIGIRSCGAYGQVMSSDYNLRDRARAYYSYDF
jgi:diaminopimelate decarboxylase